TGTITDATGTSLTVTNAAAMTATGAITLNDIAGDVLSIGTNAAFSGTSITIGAPGTANLGSLTFNSSGAVTVQEDSDTQVAGVSTANSLALTSAGAITDDNLAVTSVTVANAAAMTAVGAITLNDNGSDVLSVGGNAAFTGTVITIGTAGTANFGSLTFTTAGAVTVREASDTLLAGANTASNLTLRSTGAIAEAATASLTVADLTTLGAAGNIVLTNNNNSLNRLTVTTAANVAIKDDGNTNSANQGLIIEGANSFTGSGFVIATRDGMRFGNAAPGATTITGPAGSNVILIAGEVGGLPGVSESSGSVTPPETVAGVVPNPPPFSNDLDVIGSDTYVFANSLQSASAPAGTYIRPFNSAGDPIRNVKFNFGFAAGNGTLSVDGILGDFGVASLGSFQGLDGDTAIFFTSAPFIDIAISDAAEEAKRFLRSVVRGRDSVGFGAASVNQGKIIDPGTDYDYYGPYWTIGYDYDRYDKDRDKVPPPHFPLYYYFDQHGQLQYLLNQ
ncbi:MAG: hypothetical protein NTW21_03985, partial [Verrucomicrobia bacterium]|nr:hypothetical protein [Verrucomicrobiota bacterium]